MFWFHCAWQTRFIIFIDDADEIRLWKFKSINPIHCAQNDMVMFWHRVLSMHSYDSVRRTQNDLASGLISMKMRKHERMKRIKVLKTHQIALHCDLSIDGDLYSLEAIVNRWNRRIRWIWKDLVSNKTLWIVRYLHQIVIFEHDLQMLIFKQIR